MRLVALLRGINVGGKHKLPMAELRAEMEKAGYKDVSTYIQSGNVLLTHTEPGARIENALEDLIESRFGFRPAVIVRSQKELAQVLEKAPFDPGDEDYPHQFVSFFREPIQGDLPPDPPNGSCRYLLKTDRELYSQWYKVNGKYEVPNLPKNVQVGTMRNRRVLMALLERL